MKTFLKFILVSAVTILVLLLFLRVLVSPVATAIVNRRLAALPEFTGRVESVQIALWRGTVSATDFRLFARGKESDGPVVKMRHATLTIAWLPLLKGKLGGHGGVDGIEVMIVNESGVDDPDKNKPPVRKWQDILRNAFPMEITRFEIKDARIAFDDRSTHPAAKLVIDQFHLVATRLGNRQDAGGALSSHVTVAARVGGTGRLAVDVLVNPGAAQPHFSATMEVKALELVPIHDFLVKNALIDVSRGSFEVYAEINASGGHYEGYIKPFFKDLKFKAVPDPSKNILQRAGTKLVSAVQDLLKNDRDQVATKAPFKGDFRDNQVDIWTTVENLLRNAFVQSLREGLEGHPAS